MRNNCRKGKIQGRLLGHTTIQVHFKKAFSSVLEHLIFKIFSPWAQPWWAQGQSLNMWNLPISDFSGLECLQVWRKSQRKLYMPSLDSMYFLSNQDSTLLLNVMDNLLSHKRNHELVTNKRLPSSVFLLTILFLSNALSAP